MRPLAHAWVNTNMEQPTGFAVGCLLFKTNTVRNPLSGIEGKRKVTPPDHLERIVVLETNMETMQRTHEDIMSKLEVIQSQLTRYHGFLGGVAFIISGVGVLWTLLGGWFKSHWS